MGSIIPVDLNNAIATLGGTVNKDFTLENPDSIDALAPTVENGKHEEIGGALYVFVEGTTSPSGSDVDGVMFMYAGFKDGSTEMELIKSDTVPTWSGSGFYANVGYLSTSAKAIFKYNYNLELDTYSKKIRVGLNNGLYLKGALETETVYTSNIVEAVPGAGINFQGKVILDSVISKVAIGLVNPGAALELNFPTSGGTFSYIAAVDPLRGRVARIDSVGPKLGMFKQNTEGDFILEGIELTISNIDNDVTILAVDKEAVLLLYATPSIGSFLRLYTFDGSIWTQRGGDYQIIADHIIRGVTDLSLLSWDPEAGNFGEGYISIVFDVPEPIYMVVKWTESTLTAYNFPTYPGTIDSPKVAALSGSLMVFKYEDNANTHFKILNFDGSTVTEIDSDILTGITLEGNLLPYSSTSFIYVSAGADKLVVFYSCDGSRVYQIGAAVAITGPTFSSAQSAYMGLNYICFNNLASNGELYYYNIISSEDNRRGPAFD